MGEKSRLLITEDIYGRIEIVDASLFNIHSDSIPEGSILVSGHDIETEVF